MAVFPSRLAYPAQYSVDPIDVFVLGDTALRYGEFVGGTYTIGTSYGISAYKEEEVWDETYEEYVNQGVSNMVHISLDVTGFSKLIISAKKGSSYDSDGYVGWFENTGNSMIVTSKEPTTTVADYEFDISGQTAICIRIYSLYYNVYVQGIRLE